MRSLSSSGLTETGFFIPDSVSGKNQIKELAGIPAGILMDLFALKLMKIRALLVHPIGSTNFSGFLGTVKSKSNFFCHLLLCKGKPEYKSKQNEGFKKMEFRVVL